MLGTQKVFGLEIPDDLQNNNGREEHRMNGKEIVSRFLEAEAKQDVKGWPMFWRKTLCLKCHLPCRAYLTAFEGKGTVVKFLEQFLGKERGMFTDWNISIFGFIPAAIRISPSLNWMGKVW
jgi:hypothetical protein